MQLPPFKRPVKGCRPWPCVQWPTGQQETQFLPSSTQTCTVLIVLGMGWGSFGRVHLQDGILGSVFLGGQPILPSQGVSGLLMSIRRPSPPCAFTCCGLQTRGLTQAGTTAVPGAVRGLWAFMSNTPPTSSNHSVIKLNLSLPSVTTRITLIRSPFGSPALPP